MIWGFHINATSDFGNVGWYDGIVMAGGYTLDIKVHGKSVHTAYPEMSVNPIVILSRVAVAVDGLKQMIRATRPYSVSLMHMDCPNVAHSASPAEGRLIIKTRYHEPEVNKLLVSKIRAIVKSFCDLYGATFEIAEEQGLEPTYNHESMGPLVRENAAALGLPVEHIFASMGGDDFGCYGWDVPAYYMTFGLRKGENFHIAHTSKFEWDEAILPPASAMFASCALRKEYPELKPAEESK
jgi:metal-dependent amidase/aminoacylase/carboxypeptidase family protein